MDRNGAEMPSRYPDMKGLGPWNTWHNRFAILDAKYYIMMYNRTRNHGVYIDTPYESSNHSSNSGYQGDDTYYDKSLLDIEDQLLVVENNARTTYEFEEGSSDDSATTKDPSIPSSNTPISSEEFPSGHELDLRLNNEHSTQKNKPQVKSSPSPVGVALNAERTVIGASYTLSLLEDTRDDQSSPRHGWDNTMPSRRTNRMALLSTVARGMCRRPGEVVALCLEVQTNTLTAITQNELYEDDGELELRTGGENGGTHLPVESNVQRYV